MTSLPVFWRLHRQHVIDATPIVYLAIPAPGIWRKLRWRYPIPAFVELWNISHRWAYLTAVSGSRHSFSRIFNSYSAWSKAVRNASWAICSAKLDIAVSSMTAATGQRWSALVVLTSPHLRSCPRSSSTFLSVSERLYLDVSNTFRLGRSWVLLRSDPTLHHLFIVTICGYRL